MKYARHRSKLKKKKSAMIILPLVLAIVIIFFFLFTTGKNRDAEEEVEETVSEEMNENAETVTSTVIAPSQMNVQQITLRSENADYSATAKRGVENGLFTHVIVADLPPLPGSGDYYEGWLVKPGVVEFFSTGELFLRADGKWGLVFELREENTRMNLLDYSRVIITREKRDGNPAPSAEHVLEGEFMP